MIILAARLLLAGVFVVAGRRSWPTARARAVRWPTSACRRCWRRRLRCLSRAPNSSALPRSSPWPRVLGVDRRVHSSDRVYRRRHREPAAWAQARLPLLRPGSLIADRMAHRRPERTAYRAGCVHRGTGAHRQRAWCDGSMECGARARRSHSDMGVGPLGAWVLAGFWLYWSLPGTDRGIVQRRRRSGPGRRDGANAGDEPVGPGAATRHAGARVALDSLGGDVVTLDSLRESGKPFLLVFTRPNCPSCDGVLPEVAL